MRTTGEAAHTGHRCGSCASGLMVVGHDGPIEMAIRSNLKRLTSPFLPVLNPKPWRVSKRYINKSCKLQVNSKFALGSNI